MREPLLIVMCGLPGSGKSTLSTALARELGALRWDKDALRRLLFPPPFTHDRALNDLCMEVLYAALPHAFRHTSVVILDGRPFTRLHQRTRAAQAARDAGAGMAFIVCTAPHDVLLQRIERDSHVAPDRDRALLERLTAEWEDFDGEPITVDTAALGPARAVARCLADLPRS